MQSPQSESDLVRAIASVFVAFPEPMVVLSPDGRVLWTNAIAAELLPSDRDERLLLADDTEITLGDGRTFRVRSSTITRPWPLTVAVLHERTDVHRQIRGLMHQASTDALTGLSNRLHLEEVAARWADQAVGALFIDLDRFKSVNDTYGHDAGNDVLAAVAGRLSASVRRDDLVVRWGGDEFLILTTDPDSLGFVASRIQALLEHPISLDGGDVVLGASIGQAKAQPPWSLERVTVDADRDMYRHKRARADQQSVLYIGPGSGDGIVVTQMEAGTDGPMSVEIIDVRDDPDRAAEDQVRVTPTLVVPRKPRTNEPAE